MKEKDFEKIAEAIGPSLGATREALRNHFVRGMNRNQSAVAAGVSRATMTEYASKWMRLIGLLSSVDWRNTDVQKSPGKKEKPTNVS